LNQQNELLFKIKLLQILDAVKILITDLPNSRSSSFYINLKTFLAPKVRNSYKITQDEEIPKFFQRGRWESYKNLIECRIIKFIDPKPEPTLFILALPTELFLSIAQYLNKNDLLNMMMLNTGVHEKLNKDARFWMNLYHKRFRKTGFKLHIVNWKSAYLKKIKG